MRWLALLLALAGCADAMNAEGQTSDIRAPTRPSPPFGAHVNHLDLDEVAEALAARDGGSVARHRAALDETFCRDDAVPPPLDDPIHVGRRSGCSGIFVGRHTVLTAAHCVKEAACPGAIEVACGEGCGTYALETRTFDFEPDGGAFGGPKGFDFALVRVAWAPLERIDPDYDEAPLPPVAPLWDVQPHIASPTLRFRVAGRSSDTGVMHYPLLAGDAFFERWPCHIDGAFCRTSRYIGITGPNGRVATHHGDSGGPLYTIDPDGGPPKLWGIDSGRRGATSAYAMTHFAYDAFVEAWCEWEYGHWDDGGASRASLCRH